MRLTLLALFGVLCLAYAYAVPVDTQITENEENAGVAAVSLLDVDAQGHANQGAREARGWGHGGWGHSGWGHGGWGNGGWGQGGWGHGGWGHGGWGHGGHGGWGRGGWGW